MMGETRSEATFLLIRTRQDAYELARSIAAAQEVAWASPAYGPYAVIAYGQAPTQMELTSFIEEVRARPDVVELDPRMCKYIPGDASLAPLEVSQPEVAVLLINVDHRQTKERTLTYNLRKNDKVRLARAMWGPADIIAVVEAADHESMRNLICDEIKVMPGVTSNTTLYCYPRR